MKKSLFPFVTACLFLLLAGCSKIFEEQLPIQVSTNDPMVFGTTAVIGGDFNCYVTLEELQEVDFGCCLSTSGEPTLNDQTFSAKDNVLELDGKLFFSIILDDLKPNKTYYARAFLSLGDNRTIYGDVTNFTTGSSSGDNEFLEFTVKGIKFKMIQVTNGTFYMGCQGDDPTGHNYDADTYNSEKPVRKVTLTKNYYIGETEVTQELWNAVMDLGDADGENLPATNISWDAITNEFLPKLNAMTGRNFRLPTEAEWEFAGRDLIQGIYLRYAGSNNVDEVAWYDANSGGSKHSVGQLSPNDRGLYDMCGNVAEWCQDWLSFYTGEDLVDPEGTYTADYPGKVVKGGTYNFEALKVKLTYRVYSESDKSYNDVGFRLVCDE